MISVLLSVGLVFVYHECNHHAVLFIFPCLFMYMYLIMSVVLTKAVIL